MDAVTAAARQAGRVVAEAFMYRHHPQTLLVKEIVDSGRLGELQYIRGSFSYILTREGNFRADPERGGGSIWDVGCYPISYARLLAGTEPLEVFGRQTPPAAELDMAFVGQMLFPGDVHAQFDSAFVFPFRVQIEVVGREASLYVTNPYKPGRREKLLLVHGDKQEFIRVPGKALYAGEVEDMESAVLEGASTHISLDDSRGNLAAILALLESARTGLPQHPQDFTG